MMHCCEKGHKKITEMLKDSKDYIDGVEKVSEMFSLLGETNRMKIILALSEGELCVYHICEITGGKQSATSQHLRKLKDGNLVKSRKEGNLVLYSLADEHVSKIVKIALQHQDC